MFNIRVFYGVMLTDCNNLAVFVHVVIDVENSFDPDTVLLFLFIFLLLYQKPLFFYSAIFIFAVQLYIIIIIYNHN